MQGRIELPPRLLAVAEYIPAGTCVVDIGTDHGYLPVFVVASGKCPRAIAADVGEGPLASAKRHIEEAGLTDRVETRLSDGLDAFCPEEVSCVVMAGMGGYLIAELLERSSCQGKLKSCAALVLQPQSETDRVRLMLHEIGFRLEAERMAEDRGKRYTVLLAVPGREKYRPEEYVYGRKLWQARDPVFFEALREDREKLSGIIEGLSEKEESNRKTKRIQELKIRLEQAERMLAEWDIR